MGGLKTLTMTSAGVAALCHNGDRRHKPALHLERIAECRDWALPLAIRRRVLRHRVGGGSAAEPLATILDLNGYLPIGVPMLKRVLALPGQTVCRHGVSISVDAIVMGEARERDGRGRPLPNWQGCRAVGEGELFLMNWQSDDSLDGRYFGVLPASAVIGRARPCGPGRNDLGPSMLSICHWSVRSVAAPFLRPDRKL